ncbi:hypothetical protein FQR65_LT01785 [Abscondita terminalis]|nr:hypothetical protein FQR65_LT01785 [Abscondita terminalis]
MNNENIRMEAEANEERGAYFEINVDNFDDEDFDVDDDDLGESSSEGNESDEGADEVFNGAVYMVFAWTMGTMLKRERDGGSYAYGSLP